jgi:prepilin-type N-terminal cleavage/methylation domain-containing protein
MSLLYLNILTNKKAKNGFTLIEMMIVISIIVILLGIAMFPYRYYMQRWYTERAADGIAQEWVLAHRAIRWGLQFDPVARNKHARLFFVFQTGAATVESYLLSGSTDLATFALPDIVPSSFPDTSNPDIIHYKTLTLDDGVEILGFTGSLYGSGERIGYMISPPYGDGIFFDWSSSGSLDDARVIVGYPGADTITGRAREVLLRTYLR